MSGQTRNDAETKAIFTDHDGWTGLKFKLSDEASRGAMIAITEDLLASLRDMPPKGSLLITRQRSAVLRAALAMMWRSLGEDAELTSAAAAERLAASRGKSGEDLMNDAAQFVKDRLAECPLPVSGTTGGEP